MSNPKASSFQRPVAVLSGVLLTTLLATGAALAGASTTPPSIIAMSQKPKSGAVSITYAYLPKDGALDIFAISSSGKMESEPLGNVDLKAGDHRDVSVTLNPLPQTGDRLVGVIEQSGHPLEHSGDLAERTFSVL